MRENATTENTGECVKSMNGPKTLWWDVNTVGLTPLSVVVVVSTPVILLHFRSVFLSKLPKIQQMTHASARARTPPSGQFHVFFGLFMCCFYMIFYVGAQRISTAVRNRVESQDGKHTWCAEGLESSEKNRVESQDGKQSERNENRTSTLVPNCHFSASFFRILKIKN